ncbi:hypothetical protein GCM10010983_23390 [Caulobacter rhizosphaerae]|nr:hypothetical protein GCM10010983_23390 [Caulobacter rhizosphaerae]
MLAERNTKRLEPGGKMIFRTARIGARRTWLKRQPSEATDSGGVFPWELTAAPIEAAACGDDGETPTRWPWP